MADRRSNTTGEFRMHVIDVGQGDSLLLEGPDGDTMLIDSGPYQNSGERVLDYLDEHDIDHLDHLVATHYDADHIGGHAAVIEEFGSDSIGTVHGPDMSGVKDANSKTMENYMVALTESGLAEHELREESDLHLGDVDIDVLNPSPESVSTGRNENSVVMHCTYGEQSALLTGDIKHGTEGRLVEEYPDKLSQVDVVKIAHHGSKDSINSEFLETCDAETAIFAHAEQNKEDHPHEETLDRTAAETNTAVSTALHGSTVLDFDGENTISLQNTTSTANFAVMTRYCREHDEDFDTTLTEDSALAYEGLPHDIPIGVVNDTSNVKLPREVQELREKKEELRDDKDDLQADKNELLVKNNTLLGDKKNLLDDKNELLKDKIELQDENEDLREQVDDLQTTLDDFADTGPTEPAETETSTTVEMTHLTTAEKVNVAIRSSETVEEVRQMLADYPDATEQLHEGVQTDRTEHVTTSTEAVRNAQAYRQAEHRVERASLPLRDRLRSTVPSSLGGVDAADLKDEQLADETEDIGPTECHPAVEDNQTAAEKRKHRRQPSDDLQTAEDVADTAVDTAETGEELCESLRNTPGAHTDFLHAIRTPNAHLAHETEEEKEKEPLQTTTRGVSKDRDNDEDPGRGIGL